MTAVDRFAETWGGRVHYATECGDRHTAEPEQEASR